MLKYDFISIIINIVNIIIKLLNTIKNRCMYHKNNIRLASAHGANCQ